MRCRELRVETETPPAHSLKQKLAVVLFICLWTLCVLLCRVSNLHEPVAALQKKCADGKVKHSREKIRPNLQSLAPFETILARHKWNDDIRNLEQSVDALDDEIQSDT